MAALTGVDGATVGGWVVGPVGVLCVDGGPHVRGPARWATELESWAAEFGDETVLAFDTNQRSRFARAVDRFLTAVRSGALSHADDERLTGHVLAAALEKVRSAADEADGRTMYVLVKPEDGRKIDLAVAAVLAYEAAMTMPVVEPVEFFVYF